jgi:hypothetical protein
MLRNAKGFVFDLGHRNGLPMAVVMMFLPLAGLVVASYFVVRWAVAAGIRDAGGGSAAGPRTSAEVHGGPRPAREVLGGRGVRGRCTRSVYARGEVGREDHQRVRREPETPQSPVRITVKALSKQRSL